MRYKNQNIDFSCKVNIYDSIVVILRNCQRWVVVILTFDFQLGIVIISFQMVRITAVYISVIDKDPSPKRTDSQK